MICIPNERYRYLLLESLGAEGVKVKQQGSYLIIKWMVTKEVIIHDELTGIL